MSDRSARLAAAPPSAPAVRSTTPLWIVAGLAMSPAVALGLGRFAYALLLPAMRADLAWSYADAGAMNTANAAGYLAGALAFAPVTARLGPKRAFVAGLLVTAAALVASGLAASFLALLMLRLIAGAAGAVAFIAGAGLTAAAGAGGGPGRAPLALGIYFGGGGLGVVVSALAVPPLLEAQGWRGGWVVLGALSFAATVLAVPALARAPAPAPRPASTEGVGRRVTVLVPTLVSYALFGAGYIAYMTFIVAYLRGQQGFSSRDVSLFWAGLGAASIAAVFAWAPVLGWLRAGWGIVATTGAVTIGAVLPLTSNEPIVAYLSAALFGGSFLAVIAAVTSVARRATPSHAWTAVIGLLTTAFALGQCVGPVLGGVLSDGPGGVRGGLLLSSAILAAAVVIAAFQRETGDRK